MNLNLAKNFKNATDHLKAASDGYEKPDAETIDWSFSTAIPDLTCSEILLDINDRIKTK